MAQKVVDLCDEYIHGNLPRCTFLKCLAGYNWSNGRHQVAVFGCNITDEDVIVGGIDFHKLTGLINKPAIWAFEYQISIQ